MEGAKKADWEVEWENTLAIAKKEGKVVVYGTMGSEVRNAIIEGFKKKYGSINLEVITGRGGEMAQKLFTERKAGLYMADLYSGGATTIILDLKPAGLFDPIAPFLILPEVKNPDMWWQKKLPFVDREENLILAFSATPSSGYFIRNTEFIKANELLSYYDLLNPKLKGKIVFDDPSVTGKGVRWFGVTLTYSPLKIDFMKDLAKQEPYITRDRRQLVEWIARGRYWIGIGGETAAIEEFLKAGAPLAKFKLKEDVEHASAGSATISVLNKAPRPNASKVFINWLLSKEGQTIYSRVSSDHSSRVDTPTDHLSSDEVRLPSVSYLLMENEEFLLAQAQHARLAKEIFLTSSK